MGITIEIFKEAGFIENAGIYHPRHDKIKFHQLFAPDEKTLINCFVATVNEELQLNGNDAIEFDTAEKVKAFYAKYNINDIWK